MSRTAVILPCHNQVNFLSDALTSLRQQTDPPAEIVVVDDASDEPVRRNDVDAHRVEYRDVAASRWYGLRCTQSPYVVFLDADDMLSPNYISAAEQLLSADQSTAVVYTDIKSFGQIDALRQVPASRRRADLGRYNGIHAGAMVRREALPSQPPVCDANAFEDWATWRQVLADGWRAVRSDGLYYHRTYATGSMTSAKAAAGYYSNANLRYARIAVLLPLSGRHLDALTWLHNQSWPLTQLELHVLNTSHCPAFRKQLTKAVAYLSGEGVTVSLTHQPVAVAGLADKDRKVHSQAVNAAVSQCWRLLCKRVPPDVDYTLTLEDDVVPPPDVIQQLLRDMTPETDVVFSPYRSRLSSQGWTHHGDPPVSCGFGCTLHRSECLRDWSFHTAPSLRWYDTTYCNKKKLICVWAARSVHAGIEPKS